MKTSQTWVAIPAEGLLFRRCHIESSGKRGEIVLDVEGHVPMHIGMSRCISFSSMSGVMQQLVTLDDVGVSLTLEPADKPVRVIEAKILYWLDEPVEECFARARQRTKWDPRACFDVRLGFQVEEDITIWLASLAGVGTERAARGAPLRDSRNSRKRARNRSPR